MTNFFHGGIKKAAADELLLADNGDGVTGKFLVRSKGGSTNDFILSVVYKGAATHHAVARAGEGEEFTINKTASGQSTIAAVSTSAASRAPSGFRYP